MLTTVKGQVYTAFGLSVRSEIPLPELLNQHKELECEMDLTIEKGDLIQLWSDLASTKSGYVVRENLVMFHVPNIAIFSIQDGKRITISPLDGYDEEIVRLYTLGTCMGAILMQRRVFPLHGSAIAIGGKAYAIIGDSGAGKSTLASALLNHGYQLLSDDVIAISFREDEVTPYVTPSYPQQKLWQTSLEMFGMEQSQYQSIYGRENKYSVPVTTRYYFESLPLGGVFELEKTQDENIKISKIERLGQLKTLSYHTYRNFLIPNLGLMEWHFNTSIRVINNLDIYRLSRPNSSYSVPQLVSTMLTTINKGEIAHD
jgi:hypothetical protein